ncbi:hypothetical protein PHMEG_00019820, partial [Phytophthora megakarya]
MAENFGFIPDGWTRKTERCLAVYGCYETKAGPQYALLSPEPVMDAPDDYLNADGQLAVTKLFL